MDRIVSKASKFVWPNVSTQEGIFRACSIGAGALAWIGSTYAVSFLDMLSGGVLVGGRANEDGLRIFALLSLGGAVAAAAYLSVRIWEQRCPLAAWVGLLWIGYGTINALLGITANNAGVFLVLLYAAFQGVRGCTILSDASDDRNV